MDKSKLTELDKLCLDVAEVWVMESVNDSSERNEALKQAAEQLVRDYRLTPKLHLFPYKNNWRDIKEHVQYECIVRKLIKQKRAPISYSMYTEAFAVRLVIEHFSDEDLFGDRFPSKIEQGVKEFKENAVALNKQTDELIETLSKPKESTMSNNKAIKIENVTFVSVEGSISRTDIKSLSLENAIEIIKESEKAISALKDLKAQPKAVVAKIAELQAGIDALVKELDSREETK